jgi:hypothetical protein
MAQCTPELIAAFNKIVLSFLTQHNLDEETIKAWNDKSFQARVRKSVMKSKNVLPKRVVSKYLYFCQDERPLIVAENPGMNIKDVTCELGRRWRIFQANPDPIRLQRITALFDADKLRYETTKQSIVSDEAPKKRRPKSAYLFFCEEIRKTNPTATMKDMGEKWQQLKKQNKVEKYQRMAAEAVAAKLGNMVDDEVIELEEVVEKKEAPKKKGMKTRSQKKAVIKA